MAYRLTGITSAVPSTTNTFFRAQTSISGTPSRAWALITIRFKKLTSAAPLKTLKLVGSHDGSFQGMQCGFGQAGGNDFFTPGWRVNGHSLGSLGHFANENQIYTYVINLDLASPTQSRDIWVDGVLSLSNTFTGASWNGGNLRPVLESRPDQDRNVDIIEFCIGTGQNLSAATIQSHVSGVTDTSTYPGIIFRVKPTGTRYQHATQLTESISGNHLIKERGPTEQFKSYYVDDDVSIDTRWFTGGMLLGGAADYSFTQGSTDIPLSVNEVLLGLNAGAPSLVAEVVLDVLPAELNIQMGLLHLLQQSTINVDEMELIAGIGAAQLEQDSILDVSDSGVDASVGAVVLQQQSYLGVAGIELAAAAELVQIGQSSSLTVEGLGIVSYLDAVLVFQHGVLGVHKIGVDLTAELVMLVQQGVLIADSLTMLVVGEGIVLDMPEFALDVGSLHSSVYVDAVEIVQKNMLGVNDALLSVRLDSFSIGGGVFSDAFAMGFIVRDFNHVMLVEA